MKTLFLLIALLVSSQIHAECMSGNCQNGTGTFEFDNGKYEGDFVKGSRTGKGTFTWARGDKYVGEWKDDKRHGKGVYTYASGTTKSGVWENGGYFGTETEWEAEQTKRRLAKEEKIVAEIKKAFVEEKKRVAKEKARKKYRRIYNACLLDKGKEVDMSVGAMRQAVQATCKDIAEDPSWWEELKYD
jgi:hypothetical protein